jgi:hypothetical protein
MVTRMNGIVEMHTHKISRVGVGNHWQCTHVYLDGQQCQAVWALYPHAPGDGSRVMTREAISNWVKAGGKV